MFHPLVTRVFLLALAAASFETPLVAIADPFSDSAPADEYFGRRHESVLEIRNRLVRLEQRNDEFVYDYGFVHQLDELAGCMLDWQSQYPNDPWLPNMLWRLHEQYRRAGASDSDYARRVHERMRRQDQDDDS